MVSFLTKLYPRATENRLWRSDAAFKKTRNNYLKASAKNFLLLQLLFLGLFSWIMGSLFQQETHTKNITIAFVDYEQPTGGSIGHAVRNAYGSLRGDRFPSLLERSPTDYSTPLDLERAVCRTEFWAALYVTQGASARLQQALAGNVSVADYDAANVLTYIWNEARYSSVVDASVAGPVQTLSEAARVAYSSANGTGHVTSLSTPDAISIFAKPWTLSNINLQPTTQGSRAIYNTLVIILILIQEFFYLGIINGLYVSFKIYNRASPWRIIPIRTLNSTLYCLSGSLCTAGAIWAFRAGWNVNGNQFVLTWLTLWLFAHLNFLALDVVTIWLPAPYIPMALITWVVFNVTSILLPLELSPGFYKVAYAIPAHEVYQALIDIWSKGCNPQLHHALPVLFAWEVLGLLISGLGVFRRCHYATLAEEEQARQLKERVEAAMAVESHWKEEKRSRRERRKDQTEAEAVNRPLDAIEKATGVGDGEGEQGSSQDDKDLESELSQALSRTDDARIRREQSKASRVDYGPAFHLPFGSRSDGDE
jgi:hypothetical protein